MDLTGKKVLHLSLKKEPFEVMVTGEKIREYREPSDWIKSRLYKNGKRVDYDFIKYVNGYGSTRPYFITTFSEFYIQPFTERIEFSNGFAVTALRGDFVIISDKILERGNLK